VVKDKLHPVLHSTNSGGIMPQGKLDVLLKTYNKAKAELQKDAKKLFVEAAKELFDKYQELDSFGWVQYTPYFNDGDECIFGILSGTIINDYNTDYDDFMHRSEKDPNYNRQATPEELEFYKHVEEPIRTLIIKLPDELMKEVFGDHSQITITRKGRIITEDYDHD
jgi:hypothetical protein